MGIEDRLIWTVLTAIIGLLSYWGFQYLHNLLNSWMQIKHPEYVKKYPWLFSNSSHKYVFLFVVLKISVVIGLLWLQIVSMPKILG